jgi:hypothetical protein
VWLALTLAVSLVAAYGVEAVASQGFLLTTAAVCWHTACGIIAAFTGIGLVALAQVGLWSEPLRRNRDAALKRSGGALLHV